MACACPCLMIMRIKKENIMVRYLISIVILLGGIIGSTLPVGNTPGLYIDWHSLVIAVVLPFLFVGILLGFRKTGMVFSAPFKKNIEAKQLLFAYSILKIYGWVICIVSIIDVLIGLITVFSNTNNIDAISRNIAVISLTPLYGAIINIVLVVPFMILVREKLRKI